MFALEMIILRTTENTVALTGWGWFVAVALAVLVAPKITR